MRNLRLVLAYDGTEFHGWQRQAHLPTVQGCLESAIARILQRPASVCGSGRTDAGVHALAQVANFKTDCSIPCPNLRKALNAVLPPSVRVTEVSEVPESFHARYHARAKIYRYRILQAAVCPPFLWRFVYHYPSPLDRARMAAAARLLEGRHDFSAFAGSDHDQEAGGNQGSEQQDSRVRRVLASRILWRPRASIIVYEIRGAGFLHHMVRNIVGTLIEVGSGKLEPDAVRRILESRDRSRAGPTAPARGLCLVRVEY